MAQKGVVKNGDAFCLECRSSVDRDADRCHSCDAVLDEEVKAFSCPRCRTVLPLGTADCPQCGMRFRAKTLKQRLTPWASGDRPADDEQVEKTAPSHETVAIAQEGSEAADQVSPEQLGKLRLLVESIDRLAENRAELLSSMKERHTEEKLRLTELKSVDESSPRLDLVESEVIALADEIADIAKLHASMRSIADEISTLVESFDLSDEAKTKGLAAKALKMVSETGGADVAEMNARDDQLTKREEMVDRKIRGYASKRKELEDQEAEIASDREKLDKERAEFEQLRKELPSQEEAASAQAGDWRKTEADISTRISKLCEAMSDCDIGPDSAAGQSIESGLSAIEDTTRKLMSERSEDKAKIKVIEEQEAEIKRLLKALDQLLGQLPEDAIQRFTQSEDYKLYELILDRYEI